MGTNNKARVEMVDFDQVKEIACISFISSKGQPLSVFIHRDTFRALVGARKWNNADMGEPNLYQRELKEALGKDIKGNQLAWFDETANGILESRTKANSRA